MDHRRKRKAARRHIALAAALALLALCCAGCVETAEGRQAKQGKEQMEAWLKTRDDAKQAAVLTAATERERPAPDRTEMTEFVFGKYRLDGAKYDYWIDVKTGEIFTSERMAAFKSACYELMLSELGVDGSNCVGLCNVDFARAPRDTVMPAEIDDPAGYARAHLHTDAFGAFLWLVCSASEAPPGRWTQKDTADWNQDKARICVMPAGEALPEFGNGVNLGYYYFRDFAGDKYQLSREAVEYTPAAS